MASKTATFDRKSFARMRRIKAFSFEDVSTRLRTLGHTVSYNTVRNWETGRTLPDANAVQYIAAVFGTTVPNLYSQRTK